MDWAPKRTVLAQNSPKSHSTQSTPDIVAVVAIKTSREDKDVPNRKGVGVSQRTNFMRHIHMFRPAVLCGWRLADQAQLRTGLQKCS